MGDPEFYERMIEEWDKGEKFTEEEEKIVEDVVNKQYYEDLKDENMELKAKVEEMTKIVEEESMKRVKAEAEVKREKEMVDKLLSIMVKRSTERTESREEETLGSREHRGRREECRDLGRPGMEGRACRYDHVVREEVARTEVRSPQQEQGFLQPPTMVRGVRSTMGGGIMIGEREGGHSWQRGMVMSQQGRPMMMMMSQ